MTQETVVDLVQMTILTVITAAAPPLIMGLTVGVIVSIFQTITSIQEQTLAFVPKILAVLLSLVIFGSFIMTTIEDYMIQIISMIPDLVTPK